MGSVGLCGCGELDGVAELFELGTDYLAGKDQPDRRRRLLVAQLEQLGYTVQLTTAA